MSEMDNATRRQILDEILEMTRGRPMADDEFTAKQFSAVSGLSEDSASKKLRKLIKQKKLEKRLALLEGSWRNVYKKVSE